MWFPHPTWATLPVQGHHGRPRTCNLSKGPVAAQEHTPRFPLRGQHPACFRERFSLCCWTVLSGEEVGGQGPAPPGNYIAGLYWA